MKSEKGNAAEFMGESLPQLFPTLSVWSDGRSIFGIFSVSKERLKELIVSGEPSYRSLIQSLSAVYNLTTFCDQLDEVHSSSKQR
jgi:hypothetical protein